MGWNCQELYREIICKQLEDKVKEAVNMHLSEMKPLTSRWIIETCYLSSKPSIIINGFHAAGIVDALK